MKTPLSFCLAAAVAGTFACADDGGAARDTTGGSGGQSTVTGSAGSGGSTGVAGSAGSPGSAGAPGGGVMTGDALTIGDLEDTNVPISDPSGKTGINGAAYVVRSMLMSNMMITTQATLTASGGKICMQGATVPVPKDSMGGDNYNEYWGAEIDFDLNRVAADGAAPVAVVDAGADAGDAGAAPLGTAAGPWDPTTGKVVGFSFVVEGQGAGGAGIPAAFRFKSRPSGSMTSENFCTNMTPMSGVVNNVLFTDIRRDCWNMPSDAASLFKDPANYTQLQNLGWQVPAQLLIGLDFNFCVSQIKPIITP